MSFYQGECQGGEDKCRLTVIGYQQRRRESTDKKGIDGEEVKYVKEGDEGIGIHHLFVDD